MMDWSHLLSPRRLGKDAADAESGVRTGFQRDFDRIVYSSAFRRLQDKTQVFPLAQSDYVRTRLTHSLEAASVGRFLGALVGEEIIARHRLEEVGSADVGAILAAACLAHDIGNPPFGHMGEAAIQEWFARTELGRQVLAPLPEAQRSDFLEFEGNAQGFRLVTRLQSPDNQGGMQLTCATLGTFTKYPCASFRQRDGHIATKKFGFFTPERGLFEEVAAETGLVSIAEGAWARHPLAFLMEAADDICYTIVDLEDGFRIGLLDFEEVAAPMREAIADPKLDTRLAGFCDDKERIEYLRARAINQVANQVARAFLDYEGELLDGSFRGELLDEIPAKDAVAKMKELGLDRVYVAEQVLEIEAAGFRVLGGLLQFFVEAVEEVAASVKPSLSAKTLVRLLPQQFLGADGQPDADPYTRLIQLTDFVSGMTDSYAVSLYKKLTGISLPGR